MSRPRRSAALRPVFDRLEIRETPAALATMPPGLDVQAMRAVLAEHPADSLPNGTWTGPFGGTITVSTTLDGNVLSQSIAWTGPDGGPTITESGTYTINYREQSLSGRFTVTASDRILATGTLEADLDGDTLTHTLTVTGARGRTVTHTGTIVFGEGAFQADATMTGPAGRAVERSLVVTTTDAGQHQGVIIWTGPGGRSFTRTFAFGDPGSA